MIKRMYYRLFGRRIRQRDVARSLKAAGRIGAWEMALLFNSQSYRERRGWR